MRDALDRIRSALPGMTLSHIWHGHGSALFLEFGDLTERRRRNGTPSNPWGQVSVGLEFDWRIEFGGRIICGSGSDSDLWKTHLDRIRGATAVHLSLSGDIPELRLELSTGHRLLTFSLYEHGPEWALTDRRAVEEVWVYARDGKVVADTGRNL